LDELAQRIEPAATWEDLVLPESQKQIPIDVVAHAKQRATVYETWGFASKGARGLGISALFSGTSGTGKPWRRRYWHINYAWIYTESICHRW